MSSFFIDTTAGRLIRLTTGSRFLKYPEEIDPSLIEKYINIEKSGNLARTGTTQSSGAEKEKEVEPLSDSSSTHTRDSANTSTSTIHDPNALVNVPSGQPVDPERGRDGHVVDWYGPDDPENPMNWSRPRKFYATFCICFLTFVSSNRPGSWLYCPLSPAQRLLLVSNRV